MHPIYDTSECARMPTRKPRMRVYNVLHVFACWALTRHAIFNLRPIFLRHAVFLRLSRDQRPALLLQLDDPHVRLHQFYLDTAGVVCWEATTLDNFDASPWPRSVGKCDRPSSAKTSSSNTIINQQPTTSKVGIPTDIQQRHQQQHHQHPPRHQH